jgi:hypothetical protein
MMADTESVSLDFGAVAMSLRPLVDTGDEGIAVGALLLGGLPYETGVPPEIVRDCERERRGVVLESKLYVSEGAGDGEKHLKFAMGVEPGSAIFW